MFSQSAIHRSSFFFSLSLLQFVIHFFPAPRKLPLPVAVMLVVRPSGCSSSSSALRALAVITVAAALLCAAVEPAAAAAWTQYRRFANHSGFSQTLPYHHVPSVVWSHQTPGIADTSLILSADSIFFGDASGTVRAVEKSSGKR